MQPDLVIRGGTVFDGTGAPPIQADVAVVGDRIAEVGDISERGRREVDAAGLHVAPGFIDIHSHSDFTLLVDPRAVSAIHQGVTCEVIGNCGYGCFPVRDAELSAGSIYGWRPEPPMTWTTTAGYLERLETARPAVNVATLTPNAQLRLATVGLSDEPTPPDAVRSMTRMLERSLEEGSWGYSTGLEYPAEAAVPEEEITELCACTARRGGIYATHTRDRDGDAVAAVDEALRTGRKAGVRLQVSHLLPRSGLDAGRCCVEAVESARESGQDVAFDMHTRLHGTTYLAAALPAWARAGTPADLASRLASPAERARMRAFRSILSAGNDWGRIILLDNARWPHYARRTIANIAESRAQAPFDAVHDLLAGVVDDLTSLVVLIAAYDEQQQREAFSHPLCVPASDATALAPDGPLAGSAFHGAYSWAAWFYRWMVRDQRLLEPAEAIHKLTGQPAAVLGLEGRGQLAAGSFADIAVFDPGTFAERATTFEPNQLATGMRHVVVNGVPTVSEGIATGDRAGRVLRFPGRR